MTSFNTRRRSKDSPHLAYCLARTTSTPDPGIPSYSYSRVIVATNLVILNQGQVTRTTPDLVPLSPNFPTTPTGGHLSS
ncbi:hypothetical protein TNCV_3709651 [Trichonephila clavipes]|nr:hypothetical protein TNCV_3709651 [Trichonephila clavipes]